MKRGERRAREASNPRMAAGRLCAFFGASACVLAVALFVFEWVMLDTRQVTDWADLSDANQAVGLDEDELAPTIDVVMAYLKGKVYSTASIEGMLRPPLTQAETAYMRGVRALFDCVRDVREGALALFVVLGALGSWLYAAGVRAARNLEGGEEAFLPASAGESGPALSAGGMEWRARLPAGCAPTTTQADMSSSSVAACGARPSEQSPVDGGADQKPSDGLTGAQVLDQEGPERPCGSLTCSIASMLTHALKHGAAICFLAICGLEYWSWNDGGALFELSRIRLIGDLWPSGADAGRLAHLFSRDLLGLMINECLKWMILTMWLVSVCASIARWIVRRCA